ncbi:MAG: NAD(P)-dependent oxidoreductase [Pseudomonadota bacterium]
MPLIIEPIVFTGLAATALRESDDRIIVTGASGWIGMTTLEMLHGIFGSRFPRRVVCFGSNARTLTLRNGVSIEQKPLDRLGDLPSYPSTLLHYAYLTREKTFDRPLGEYIATNRNISSYIESQALRIGVERIFITSSGAVYNTDRSLTSDIENNAYGFLKLEDEKRFIKLAGIANARIAVARVFNVAGPYINKWNSYALASIVLDALRGYEIAIKSSHRVVRSYTEIAQLVSMAFAFLYSLDSEKVLLFDTAGEEEIEIGALATTVNQALGVNVPVKRAALHSAREDRYVGDGGEYLSRSYAYGVDVCPLKKQIQKTAAYLKNH